MPRHGPGCLQWPALAAGFASPGHQHGRRVAGRGVAQATGGTVIDAVPDGAEQLVVALHLVGLIERGEHLPGPAEIGPRQGLRAQRVGDRHRQDGSAHAMAADVDQVEREVLGVDPVVAERIAAQLGRGNEAPVDDQGLRTAVPAGWRGRSARRRATPAAAGCGCAAGLRGTRREAQVAMGTRQLLVGRLELLDEPCLALAEQASCRRPSAAPAAPPRIRRSRRAGESRRCRPRRRNGCPPPRPLGISMDRIRKGVSASGSMPSSNGIWSQAGPPHCSPASP